MVEKTDKERRVDLERAKVFAVGGAMIGWPYARASAERRVQEWKVKLAEELDEFGVIKLPDDHAEVKDYLHYRQGSGDSVEVFDIAVANERRGLGRGRILVELLFALVPNAYLVWAITRADNVAAQQFYQALRFRIVGNLWEFHGSDGRYDAVMYGRSPKGPV